MVLSPFETPGSTPPRARTTAVLALIAVTWGCGPAPTTPSQEVLDDPFDVPITGATQAQVRAFQAGDTLFNLPLHDADGLGPLYTRQSCGACHLEGTRGPGAVEKMFVVEADGVTAAADQSALPWGHTVHPFATAGATTPITVPTGVEGLKVSVRVGPPVLGRGYLEAISDEEILRVAAEQALRPDGIHGRVNHVVYDSEADPAATVPQPHRGDAAIGRFGLKARVATLEDFVADAFQNDMGITSPLRPTELPNPDGLTDDAKPGVDVSLASVNARADYLRLIAIPRRAEPAVAGPVAFSAARCDVCHVPALRTRADYPVALLADIDAAVYTDLLLHDLGDGLADGAREIDGEATSRQWRTAPLIGLRFSRTMLHDGRAHTVEEAILAHDSAGSEASGSVALFQGLSAHDRQALLDFVATL